MWYTLRSLSLKTNSELRGDTFALGVYHILSSGEMVLGAYREVNKWHCGALYVVIPSKPILSCAVALLHWVYITFSLLGKWYGERTAV